MCVKTHYTRSLIIVGWVERLRVSRYQGRKVSACRQHGFMDSESETQR